MEYWDYIPGDPLSEEEEDKKQTITGDTSVNLSRLGRLWHGARGLIGVHWFPRWEPASGQHRTDSRPMTPVECVALLLGREL